MHAIDIMTSTVVTVTPETTVLDTAKLFVKHGISGAPVVDENGQVLGLISEGDLLHREELNTDQDGRSWWLKLFSSSSHDAQSYVKSHARRVRDVMTEPVISVDAKTPLHEIADLLETHHIKRVPVLQAGKLIGIVSRANLIQALASTADELPSADSPPDDEIRAMLMGEIAGKKWSYVGRNVVVRNGVVHLWGSIWSAEEVHAARIAAENIPGVKGIEEHIESPAFVPGI